MRDRLYGDLVDDDLQMVDEACTRFEKNWSTPNRLTVNELVATASPHLQETLRRELTAAEKHFVELERSSQQKQESMLLPVSNNQLNHEQLEQPQLLTGSELPPFPTKFGRYEILRKIGQGAMGAVYLAEDTQLERQVALKFPKIAGADETEFLQRFYREARAASRLRSSHICPIYDVGEIDGQHYISMAYLKGRSLKEYTSSSQQQPQSSVAITLRKIALALQQAHELGIVHRDLKPDNIMIDEQGEPVVMDFGLARRIETDESLLTHPGTLLGTPVYMSPEQVDRQRGEIGPQSDIFSLGIIFYQLLTGRLPFCGKLDDVLQKIRENTPQPIESFRADAEPKLISICDKMMATDLQQRYQSMKEVADDLSDYLANAPDRKQSGNAETVCIEKATSKLANPVNRKQRSVLQSRMIVGLLVLIAVVWGGTQIVLSNRQAKTVKPSQEQNSDNLSNPEKDQRENRSQQVAMARVNRKAEEQAEGIAPEMIPTASNFVELPNGWKIGQPTEVKEVNNKQYNAHPTISHDGLTLLFTSDRDGKSKLWGSTRNSPSASWDPPQVILTEISPYGVELSTDGSTLFYAAEKKEGVGEMDLWSMTRDSLDKPWQQPQQLSEAINTEHMEVAPSLSRDGLTLAFASDRPFYQGKKESRIYLSSREDLQSPWSQAVSAGKQVNGALSDGSPALSTKGLAMVFESGGRDGSVGLGDLWMTTRTSASSAWQTPVNLGPTINTATWDSGPCFGLNDTVLYFSSRGHLGTGSSDLWMAPIQRP